MERLIKDFTIEELKALAYDNLMQIEQSQANLKALNQEIRTRNTLPPVTSKVTTSEPIEEVKE